MTHAFGHTALDQQDETCFCPVNGLNIKIKPERPKALALKVTTALCVWMSVTYCSSTVL